MDIEDILTGFLYLILIGCVIIFIILIVVLIGSAIESISYGEDCGTIIDKRYTPENMYTFMQPYYTGKTTIIIPRESYTQEKYEILIEKEVNGKKKSKWIIITKDEYDKYQKGDYYD